MEDTINPKPKPLDANYWSKVLKPVFHDKKIILAGGVVASQLPRAKQIRELGAASTFVFATEGMGTSTSEVPTEEDGDWLAIEPPASDNIIEAIHASNALLKNVPKHALEALDSYDPDCSAIVVGTFLHEQKSVAGRKSLAYRKPEWLALDDKTVIDRVWDKIGVPRESSEIVVIDRQTLLEATRKLDRGDGVVWSGDSRDGISGGAVGVRWIRSEVDADKAIEYYQKHCDRLRIMPFLEGIPCSIHGIVFPNYVVGLRPVEMVVLRKQKSNEFFYGGTATYWDPAPADREDMRAIAKRVGIALRDMVDYRGIFTVDGVLSKDGFRPTEMNTRSGAGIKPLTAGLPNFPLELIAQAVASGADLDYKPEELEALIVSSADKHRGGGTWYAVPAQLPQFEKRSLKLLNTAWKWTEESEDADGTVNVGPGPLGSFVRLTPNSSLIKAGPSFAPLARDFWRFVDENMGSQIGPLETAKSVR